MVTHESSLNSVFSMDSYKYKTDVDVMKEGFCGDKMFDYEKLMREECDCSKRKIPGLYLSQQKTTFNFNPTTTNQQTVHLKFNPNSVSMALKKV